MSIGDKDGFIRFGEMDTNSGAIVQTFGKFNGSAYPFNFYVDSARAYSEVHKCFFGIGINVDAKEMFLWRVNIPNFEVIIISPIPTTTTSALSTSRTE